ncbi:MAG: class I SAM-dependent methyltransferase [Alphaproteobacteria bacterium]|nr:class I SAM-dependent methyltransferase [Alphaproteobacteria bacterium]
MHLDVVDLKAFYYRTRLGRVAQRAVRGRVREFWPSVKGETVAGFGFASPLLRPFLNEARRVISLMPAPQGVMPWPDGQPNISLLTEETNWPLQTAFIDRLVVLHGLETSENPARLLDEIWRVMKPGGRVLFVVPNRSGLWSRRDVTPFGYGHPYSLRQLESQLKKHRFAPERHLAALYSPPSQKRFWLKVSPALERAGRAVSARIAGGVLLVEASKQIYAPTPKGLPEAVKRPLGVLQGVGRPSPEPASGRVPIRDCGKAGFG